VGILADIYVSRDDEAVRYDTEPKQFTDRVQCRNITPLELSVLWAVMRGIARACSMNARSLGNTCRSGKWRNTPSVDGAYSLTAPSSVDDIGRVAAAVAWSATSRNMGAERLRWGAQRRRGAR
jgi:hypothetical protein